MTLFRMIVLQSGADSNAGAVAVNAREQPDYRLLSKSHGDQEHIQWLENELSIRDATLRSVQQNFDKLTKQCADEAASHHDRLLVIQRLEQSLLVAENSLSIERQRAQANVAALEARFEAERDELHRLIRAAESASEVQLGIQQRAVAEVEAQLANAEARLKAAKESDKVDSVAPHSTARMRELELELGEMASAHRAELAEWTERNRLLGEQLAGLRASRDANAAALLQRRARDRPAVSVASTGSAAEESEPDAEPTDEQLLRIVATGLLQSHTLEGMANIWALLAGSLPSLSSAHLQNSLGSDPYWAVFQERLTKSIVCETDGIVPLPA
jgi:hypothetical protein